MDFRFDPKIHYFQTMNLFIIVASLILLHENYIYGFDTQQLNGIDVLATLKNKTPNCDLKSFVLTDADHTSLVDNLKHYCSLEESVKQHRLLCHMLSYVLEKACELEDKSRLSKITYTTSMPSSEEICAKKGTILTNQWIWNVITNDGKNQIDINSTNLCVAVTNDSNTRLLAVLFYKLGRIIRNVDSPQRNRG